MRQDRPPTSLRPLTTTLGPLSRADGSARFAFGPSSSLASFTGPIEVRIKDEKIDRATLEIVHRPLEGVGGVPSRDVEETLRCIFEEMLGLNAFPRALVQIVVQSLTPLPREAERTGDRGEEGESRSWPKEVREEAGGSPGGGVVAKAGAINAVTLAALHAGSVGMRAVPLAVGVALMPDGLVVDPSLEEEAGAVARFGFGWAFGAGIGVDAEEEVVWVEAEGEFSKQDLDEARELALPAVREVHEYIRGQFEEFFAKRQ